jgi:hypothetical protein
MPGIYPFDPTGLASTNRVVGEAHTLTEINASAYRIIIPAFAPFYLDNFTLSYTDTVGVVHPLAEGVDYHLTLPYVGASRSIGKMVYGAISITTLEMNGQYNVSYQTIGGEWTCNVPVVFTNIVNGVYNPRTTTWDVVTNIQELFPPITHPVDFSMLKGQEELISKLGEIEAAILAGPSVSLTNHVANFTNPHGVTKNQVGLGNVANLPMATDAEVAARAPVDKYVTLKQILSLLP